MSTENRIVKKSNRVITSRVKNYSLTQMKIMNLAISELTEQTTADDVLSFQAIDLLNAIGLGAKNHIELRKATLDMIRGIEIPKEDGGFSQVPIFKEIEYHKGGTVDIQFHEKVLPLLVQAKTEYTKYYFENIQQLKSGYSIKIYELCKQYQNTKQGYRDFTIEELKTFLDIPPKKYPRFSNFKQKILNVANLEINEKTDLKIEAKPIKKGRSTTGVRFYITPKNKEQIVEIQQPALPCDFKDLTPVGRQLVDDYQMSAKIAVELQVLATTDEHLSYAMTQFNKKLDAKYKKGETVENLARYSEMALREAIPTILVSGVVEKEKNKAEEKKKQAEVKAKKVQIEEDKKANKEALNERFKDFCSRSDLLEVLKDTDLKNLYSNAQNQDELMTTQAQKIALETFSKELVSLTANDTFDALTDNVKGFSSFSPMKSIQFRSLKFFLKNALVPLF